jgi:PTH1 family peptidyl-tRNA hydrolase
MGLMKVIFAQGNPESKYNGTRHNVGFFLIDSFAKSHDVTWSDKSKFDALIGGTSIHDEKVLLVKPTTFYNDTGISARKLVDFYNLDPSTDFLVIHDDLALPLGTIRTRKQGSDAGNNGIKSLNDHLGPDYHRIRIGTWNELRDKIDDVNFVLGKFSREEVELLESKVAPHIEKLIEQFASGSLDITSHTP